MPRRRADLSGLSKKAGRSERGDESGVLAMSGFSETGEISVDVRLHEFVVGAGHRIPGLKCEGILLCVAGQMRATRPIIYLILHKMQINHSTTTNNSCVFLHLILTLIGFHLPC